MTSSALAKALMLYWSRVCSVSAAPCTASEMAASLAVQGAADTEQTLDQYSMRAFANALDVIPMALAENSGLSAIGEMSALKARQQKDQNSWHGIDCMQTGSTDMWEANV